MNHVLIGMRGSGKTTVGKLLSVKLQKKFVESDALIVEKAGKSISEIVVKEGWEYFRDLESKAIADLSMLDEHVISTGGGAVMRPENIVALKKNGTLIYLRATIETLRNRIVGNADRPSLTGHASAIDEVEEIYLKRSPVYESVADVVIDTDELAPAAVADKVFKLIK